ncbi:ISXO2-like transposase domain-containing protein [Ditylenchus destructor]|uniref:ISXO2-like transposase domain-containing protein n=1 Tax=Ditylenchus destructor TaxID=166010 RepID=A0AAD4N3V7_9BILA|nr:ISXO2-like transposase domain-containing protein [Ditylenchus destructor]
MPSILERCKKELAISSKINGALKLLLAQRYNFTDLQVPDVTKETLWHYIDKYVAKGTYIMTDGLRSYGGLDNWDVKNFQHDVVLHKYYFVDPENPWIHTNSIESTWQKFKHEQIKNKYGTKEELFTSYIDEDVPTKILIEVLRHFSRRMLTGKMSWVNSQFYHLSRQHVPVIHLIPLLNFMVANIMLPSTQLSIYHFIRMPTPGPYIRIRTVEVHPNIIHFDDSVLKLLRSAKHVFAGADVFFHYLVGNIQRSHIPLDLIQGMESLLNEVFTEPYFISFYGNCFVPKRLFQTKGVQNCDKVERVATSREMSQSPYCMHRPPICNDVESQLYGRDSFNVAECFATWLHWKHKHANSRRHLILKGYPVETIFELANILKKEFQEATAPVNYLVSLPECGYTIHDDDMQNDVPGERLSLFSFQHPEDHSMGLRAKTLNFLWRRIPIEKSPGKTSDAEYMLMFKRECEPNEDFDEKFYSVKTVDP